MANYIVRFPETNFLVRNEEDLGTVLKAINLGTFLDYSWRKKTFYLEPCNTEIRVADDQEIVFMTAEQAKAAEAPEEAACPEEAL